MGLIMQIVYWRGSSKSAHADALLTKCPVPTFKDMHILYWKAACFKQQ